MPCEATEYTIDSIFAINGFISEIRKYVNQNLQIAGMLFSKKENTAAQNLYYDQIKAVLKDYHFFNTDIRKTTIVEKSLSEHQPLIVYAKNENVTKDYLSVADELETLIKGGRD